jgi:hypothetical protein
MRYPKISQRGFNMFSAIVAVLLIMAGVVITNTLISTEEKTNRQVYSMLNNYQLTDAAAVARADALQNFNYAFRVQMENYLTYDKYEMGEYADDATNGLGLFTIRTGSEPFTFAEMKAAFEQSVLQKTGPGDFNSVLEYVAGNTVNQFQERTYGRFSVYLSERAEDRSGAQARVKDVLYAATAPHMNNLFEVVDCGETECNNGSFYFNIPLNEISDAQYESLPRIVVKDLVTHEEIKMPILPRTNIRIYMPLRFFKAIFEARKFAIVMRTHHNEIESYKLGFCDNGCAPRTNPVVAATGPYSKTCPQTDSGAASTVALSAAPLGITQYQAGGTNAGSLGLKAHTTELLCSYTGGLFDATDTSFVPFSNSLITKDPQMVDVANCPINKIVVGLPNAKPMFEMTGLTISYADGLEKYLRCGWINEVISQVAFKETNPLYIVRGTYDPGKVDVYKIQIHDLAFPQAPLNYPVPTAKCNATGSACETYSP